MARDVRTSSRLNTSLLDRGLAASAEAGETFIKQADAVSGRVAAEGRGIEHLGLAKRNFWTSYGSGIRLGLIASGVGLGSLLFLYGVSLVVEAYRRPYSTNAYSSLLDQNASLTAQITQISKLLAEERTKAAVEPSPVVSATKTENGSPAPAPASTAAKGVATTAVPFDPTLSDCPSYKSYTEKCTGFHKYADGQSYRGEWRNGLPDGAGSLTMIDGTKLEGVWKAGLPSSVTLPKNTSKALKTVTVFNTKGDLGIDQSIEIVVTGHEFLDGNSTMWQRAYCYTMVFGADGIEKRINLSQYPSANSELMLAPYDNRYKDIIYPENFRKAQNACGYLFSGFN